MSNQSLFSNSMSTSNYSNSILHKYDDKYQTIIKIKKNEFIKKIKYLIKKIANIFLLVL